MTGGCAVMMAVADAVDLGVAQVARCPIAFTGQAIGFVVDLAVREAVLDAVERVYGAVDLAVDSSADVAVYGAMASGAPRAIEQTVREAASEGVDDAPRHWAMGAVD